MKILTWITIGIMASLSFPAEAQKMANKRNIKVLPVMIALLMTAIAGLNAEGRNQCRY